MTSILTELSQWANTLPYWEQAALDKIVAGVQLTESVYDELLYYLLEGANLAASTRPRPELQFPHTATTGFQSSTGQVQLTKISNLQDVNALVPGQTLTFGQALTAIFGANGSGKSGYARVLGCAGFTRGDKEVLPDVTQPSGVNTIPSADIETSDGISTKIIHYQVGNQCPELALFYTFDSTSVQVHLTGSNTFSFSPTGLFYLTQLANVTDKIRERLRARIEECAQSHDFSVLFQGKSAVTELISNLGHETDLEELRQMAALTSEEKNRIGELDTEIAELKAKDINTQIRKLEQTLADLEIITERLRKVENGLSDDIMSDIQKALVVYLERKSAAQRGSVDQFKSEHFTQTGSEVWHRFIEVAKVLAEAEQTPDKPYPQHEDRCLLCQQPLSTEAHELLLRLWAFLEGDVQAKLDEAQRILEKKHSELDAIDLNFFDEQSVSYRYIQEHDPALLRQVITFVEACRQRREFALRIIEVRAKETTPEMLESMPPNIEEIIKALKTDRDELEKEKPTQKIVELDQQLSTLQHREILGQHFPQIAEYVRKQIWAQKAAKIGGSTRHITNEYNRLFEQLVTDRYIRLFEQTLKDLQRPLRVKVQTKGRKGETYKQIVLETDNSAPVSGATPENVLSEGEKRAVAMADFLTEIALDTSSSGIILDDPVTSLDLEWREMIAAILVNAAKCRQVIIFTHDLPFLYFLKKHAEQEPVEIVTHWIKRGDNDDKPGYVFLDNSPALERDYRKATKARDIYKQAKGASAAEQEALLRDGFGALRTNYEAFIIFDLFGEVVMRFEERVSFGRLKNIVWDKSITDEVVTRCELLSRYIEGHLHSDAFAAKKPTCETLMSEIESFESLKGKLKVLRAK
jgi:energy-coupling factor transporter ATP-binding protein EcfA2